MARLWGPAGTPDPLRTRTAHPPRIIYNEQATSLRYPIKTVFAVGIAAAFSLYATFAFFGEQADRNKDLDPYMIEIQERRFADLKRELIRIPVAGYVSDVGDSAPAAFLTAQFVLAPTVLADGVSRQWIVGNFSSPRNYAEYAKAHQLTLVKDFSNGVVLFRRGS